MTSTTRRIDAQSVDRSTRMAPKQEILPPSRFYAPARRENKGIEWAAARVRLAA